MAKTKSNQARDRQLRQRGDDRVQAEAKLAGEIQQQVPGVTRDEALRGRCIPAPSVPQ